MDGKLARRTQPLHRDQEHEQIPLVVARAAGINMIAADGRLEGRRDPLGEVTGGLNVVVPVDQDRRCALACDRWGDPADNERMTTVSDDLRVPPSDLDLLRNSQCQAFIDAGVRVGESADGRLTGASFVRAVSASGAEAPSEARRLRIARVGDLRLYVTHFDAHGLSDAVRLQISNAPEYWRAARTGAEFTVVDAPALLRSRAGLGVAPHMDGVVLVVSGAAGSAAATLTLKGELEARGARVLGLVYAHADRGVTLLERLVQRNAA